MKFPYESKRLSVKFPLEPTVKLVTIVVTLETLMSSGPVEKKLI